MYVILLSGGSGKRLWPLSNELRSKQYIKILSREDGDPEPCSMVQRVSQQLRECGLYDNTVVCASSGQIEILKSQLGQVNIAVEPDRRDTFPAVALACAYVRDVMGAGEEDTVCVLPVDPYAELAFFRTVARLETVLAQSEADMVLMGARPTFASSEYGYIVPGQPQTGEYLPVARFREKPDKDTAAALLEQGALWNCGVFCFKIGMLVGRVNKYGLDMRYNKLYKQYHRLPAISFDYEVVEKTNSLAVIPYDGLWKDLGTWNMLSEEMQYDAVGQALLHDSCGNTHIINELNMPVVTVGTRDLLVAATFDGILVADKQHTAQIKDIVGRVMGQPMYEERRWGTIKTLDTLSDGEISTATRRITFFPDMTSSYHYHEQRDEVWTILKGTAEMVLDGRKLMLRPGSSIDIRRGRRHAIKALDQLEYIEIHIGNKVGDADIHRLTFNWEEIEITEEIRA